jgi:hypothetical protein
LEKAATPSSKKRGGRVAKSPDSDIFEPPGDKERTPKRGKRLAVFEVF